MGELQALQERLEELEVAATRLTALLNDKSSQFHSDALLQNNLVKVMKEQTVVRARIQQLRSIDV